VSPDLGSAERHQLTGNPELRLAKGLSAIVPAKHSLKSAGASLMRKVSALILTALGLVCGMTGRAAAIELSPDVAFLYTSVSVFPPTDTRMIVCYGFVCRLRYVYDIGPQDRAALTKILAAGKASAGAEREAVQNAVVWWDKRIGPVIGTEKRIARADFRAPDSRVNFDCWDTTRNVTSLLVILQDWGLLKYHVVDDPKYRGNAFVLQTPHNTPVLREKANGSKWVVDLWTVGYAQKPEVMPVAQWMTQD
jgi:hypothetical protein